MRVHRVTHSAKKEKPHRVGSGSVHKERTRLLFDERFGVNQRVERVEAQFPVEVVVELVVSNSKHS